MARRLWRRVGWGALIAVGGVLALVLVALGLVHTSFGAERVRRLVLPQVNQIIKGQLAVGRLRPHLDGFELHDVKLFDPEGQLVAEVARVDVALGLRKLIGGHVLIEKVLVERPRLLLVQSARGLNLSRAVAARVPTPKKDEGPSRLALTLERLDLRDGFVSLRDTRKAGLPPIRIEGLATTAAADLDLGAQRGGGRLDLEARTREPFDAPFKLRVAGRGAGTEATGSVNLGWGPARAVLEVKSKDEKTQDLVLEALAVPPDLVRAFVPGSPLAATVNGKGQARRRGDGLDAGFDLEAGGTRARLDATAGLARGVTIEAAHLRADAVDLGRILVDGPPSRFDVRVDAAARGLDPKKLDAQVALHVPPGSIDGRPFGPVRLEASAASGRYTVRALEAALPGLQVAGGGGTTAAGQLRFSVRALARDLALTARSLRLPAQLALGGHGRLDLALEGTLAAPGANLAASFPRLRVAGNEVEKLELRARSADLRAAPLATQLDLTVARLRAGQTVGRDVQVTLAGDAAGRVSLSARAKEPVALSLQAAGRATGAAERVDLDRFELGYQAHGGPPGDAPAASTRARALGPQVVTWRLQRPARVRVAGDLVAVEGLALAAEPGQSMTVDLEKRGARLDARCALGGFDLGRLPRGLLPPERVLGGVVDAKVAARGRLDQPDATLELRLANGRFGRIGDVSLGLQAKHERGRAAGQLEARAFAATHQVTFDLPTRWPPPLATPVKLDATLGETDLARLLALAPAPGRKLSGRAQVKLGLEGRAADPTLRFEARGKDLVLDGERIEDLVVTVDDPAGKPFALELSARLRGRASRVRLETPAVLGAWLRKAPTPETLQTTPFTVRGELDQLPLEAFAGVLRQPDGRGGLGGNITARAALVGPFRRLRGTLDLDAVGLRTPQVPATDVKLNARLGEGNQGLSARLAVGRRGRRLGALDASLGVGIDDLVARRGLASAPIKLTGRLGPMTMQRMTPGVTGMRRDHPALRAEVEVQLTAAGTLGAPRVDLVAEAREAYLAGNPLGAARLRAGYRDARPQVNLVAVTTGGGRLALDASAKVDLSLPALMRGLAVNQIPIESKLTSRGLDLAFLAAVSDEVRTVAGRLDADARVSGQVGAPQLVGRVGWKGGRVVLASYGEIRDIDLALYGDPRQMVLERLFARAGNGSANVTAKAVRTSGGRDLSIEARADLDRFRLVTEGQPLGALSLQARARGTVAPEGVALSATIDEAHMEMSGAQRRKLQTLKRSEDIVILNHGEPVDRAQARRYRALIAAQRPAAADAAVAAVPVPAVPKPAIETRTVRVAVAAPRNLWVRGPDVNLEVGLEPDFEVVLADTTRVFGTVKVRRGFVEVLGRRFDLKEGASVRFTGPADVPTLEVDASYRAESADTTVVVHIEGPTDAMRFDLRSPEHPEYGDTELMSLIATGRLPDASPGGAMAGTRAASLLGSLLADRLQKMLTSRLPIDVLTIEPGEGLTGTRLEAGTYLNDDVYVAYVGRLGNDPMLTRENRNEVHLEYQLTSHWSFEATYGDARQGSADLIWTRHY